MAEDKYSRISGLTRMGLTLIIFVLGFTGVSCKNEIPLSADQLIAKGRQSYADGKVDDAIASFKKALEMKPNDAELHFELGEIYNEERRKTFESAQLAVVKDLMRGSARPDPSDNERILIKHGYRKEFHDLSLTEFSTTLKLAPNHWKARYYIATDFFNNKNYEQAIVEFNKLISLKSDFADSYTLLGESYLRTNQYQLAIKTLKKSIDIEPGVYNYYILGLAYKRVNNWAKVNEIALKLKTMDTDYYNALLNTET